MFCGTHMQEVQSIEEVLQERSQVDELRAQLQQEQQASRAKDQQLQAHIEQTATEMQARRIPLPALSPVWLLMKLSARLAGPRCDSRAVQSAR